MESMLKTVVQFYLLNGSSNLCISCVFCEFVYVWFVSQYEFIGGSFPRKNAELKKKFPHEAISYAI